MPVELIQVLLHELIRHRPVPADRGPNGMHRVLILYSLEVLQTANEELLGDATVLEDELKLDQITPLPDECSRDLLERTHHRPVQLVSEGFDHRLRELLIARGLTPVDPLGQLGERKLRKLLVAANNLPVEEASTALEGSRGQLLVARNALPVEVVLELEQEVEAH